MAEQRKHQRVRFVRDPSVRIRQGGTGSKGALENLSLGGLQLRCATPLALQASACVELRLPGSGLLELSVRIVSRVGECYGARFIPGPLSEALLRLEMAAEVPTPAEHLNARRALQLHLLTRRNDPAPAQTWGQDTARVLASASDAASARRLQAALKALLRK